MSGLDCSRLTVVARSIALCVALLAPAVSVAQEKASPAQAPGSRWWFGAGGGYLAGRAACSNCESDLPYEDGFGFMVQGGLRATARLLVGGEVFTADQTLPSGDFRNTHLLGIVEFRPFQSAGFFLKGGYGMAVAKGVFPVEGGGQTTARTWGMGVIYGAGWIFGDGRRVSVAPVAATYITTIGDISAPQGTATNVVVNGWFLGATVMFR